MLLLRPAAFVFALFLSEVEPLQVAALGSRSYTARCSSPGPSMFFGRFRKKQMLNALLEKEELADPVACAVVCEDDEETAPPPPPPSIIKGFLPETLPDATKAVDTLLAGIGLFASIALLGWVQDTFHVQAFVPAMMASGIIFFAGPAPPDPRGFLSGTLCSATLSAFLLYTLDEVLPPVAADGASAALLLVWYKTVGAMCDAIWIWTAIKRFPCLTSSHSSAHNPHCLHASRPHPRPLSLLQPSMSMSMHVNCSLTRDLSGSPAPASTRGVLTASRRPPCLPAH